MSGILKDKVILKEILLKINSSSSLESLIDIVAKEVAHMVDYISLHVFFIYGDKLLNYFDYTKEKILKSELNVEIPSNPFFTLIEEKDEDYSYINKLEIKDTEIINSPIFKNINEENILAFKLFSRKKLIGISLISSQNEIKILEDDLKILSDIFAIFSLAADNMLLSESISQQKSNENETNNLPKFNNELVILNDITKKALSTLRISELLDFLVTYLTRQTNFDRVLILLQSKDNETDFEGLIATIENKQKFTLNNFRIDSLNPTIEELTFELKKNIPVGLIFDDTTFIAVPLIVRGKLTGILAVDNYFKQKFITGDELRLLEAIASQLDISIDNARLFEDMKSSALGFKQLFEVASSFNTILDYQQASKVIVEKIAASIAVSQGYLISFEIDNYNKVVASLNDKNNYINTEIELTEPLKQSILTKRPVIYNHNLQSNVKCLNLKYALIVPLFIKNKLAGLLCLGEESAEEKRIFNDYDIKLVQTMANQAAITLENAQLYNKLEDMVVERTVELIDSNKALKKQKEKLEILSLRLQSIISSIPDGILVINYENQILSSNPAFLNILNFVNCNVTLDALQGLSLIKLQNFLNLKDTFNRKNLEDLLLTIIKEDSLEPMEFEFVLQNGIKHYYKVITAPVRVTLSSADASINEIEDGEKTYLTREDIGSMNKVIVFHDVTKEKEIDKLKSDFIAVVSHELKTPVSAMMGFATLVEDGIAGEVSDEQIEYLSKIQTQGERLIRLINDLLDFSKLEAGQMPLYLQIMDVEETIFEVVETLRPLSDEKNMEIVTCIETDLPPIETDPDKLKQILINLISNAIKFTPENTGLIEVAATFIPGKREIIFSVKDNGIGIPEKDKERLFDRFYQVDNSSTRKFGGTGLGLAIVKKLVELNHGIVWVESKIGKGSTFYFTFPAPDKGF